MKPLTITRHAAKRQQQRSISLQSLELLWEFGRKVHDHQGAFFLIFDNSAKTAVRVRLGKAAAQLRLNIYAVFDARDDQIITTGHLTRRMKEAA